MAKKRSKSITERVNELVYKLDEVLPPEDGGFIKGKLSQISELVEALEEGSGVREAETKIETLEQQIANLELQLNAANAENDRFKDEEKKKEREDRDIKGIQSQILQRLGSPSSCEWLNVGEIARALKIPVDEAEVYIEGLDGLGLIFFHPHEPGGGGWLRTAKGNRLAVAKRWGGEEEQPSANKGLGDNATKVLILIAREDGLDETAIAERMKIRLSVIRRILRTLREDGYATDAEKPGEAFATSDGPSGPIWKLLIKGEDFLTTEACCNFHRDRHPNTNDEVLVGLRY